MPVKITSSQHKQIERFMSDALGNINISKIDAQRIIGRGGEFKICLEQVLKNFAVNDGETSDQREIRKIMGKNFLGIPEAVEHFGAIISSADRAILRHIPFSLKTLRACAKTHILVADVGISLEDVLAKTRDGVPGSCEGSLSKYRGLAECNGVVCWRLILRTPIKNSFSRGWSWQNQLVDGSIDEVPSARQIVYTMILNFLSREERMFESVYVRTCDVDIYGFSVNIGHFGDCGPEIRSRARHVKSDGLGLASARLPDL